MLDDRSLPPVRWMTTSARGWTMVVASLATFMTLLDNNVVNVAIPTIQRSLHLSSSGIEWVVSAYILFFAGLLLAGGRLADVIGRRRTFLVGLGVFTTSSLFAGLAATSTQLIVARALQGVGGALLAPTALALLVHAYPDPKEQARAVGIWGAVGALALAVGPVIGGVLSQHVSWSWIFFLNVPLGLLTLALTVLRVDRDRVDARRRFDVGGVVTSALSLFALSYALIQGTSDGWTSTVILGSFAVAALGAWAFVVVERRVADPMVDLSFFTDRTFVAGLSVLVVWAFGLFGIYFFTALYLQNVLGFSPTKAGVAFVPMALLMAVGATLSDRVAARLGANRAIALAMGLMAVGVASVSVLGAGASFVDLMPGFAVIGIGGGLTMPLTSLVLNTMPTSRAGVASAIFNASREVAGLLGITVIGVVLSSRDHQLLHQGATPVDAFLGGYRWGILVAALLVGVGGVVAWFRLPTRSRAAAGVAHEARPVEVSAWEPTTTA